jgi:hypothetical protein
MGVEVVNRGVPHIFNGYFVGLNNIFTVDPNPTL